jgi:hypothetical protein
LSIARHLRCRYCNKAILKAVRGRYGVPVAMKHGTLRLLYCAVCKKYTLAATMVINRRNARDIADIIGAS